MRRRDRLLLGVWIAITACGAATSAQDWTVPRDQHAWARFPKGAWKRMHVTTQTFNDKGEVTNATQSLVETSLKSVSRSGYAMSVQVSAAVNGQLFPTDPKDIHQRFSRQIDQQEKLGDEQVEILGVSFQTQVHQTVVNGGNEKRITKIHYASDRAPHVLRRRTVSTDSQTTLFKTDTTVTEVNKRIDVLGQTKTGWVVKTVHTQGGMTTTTTELHCVDVPGGVVSQVSEVTDADNRLVRRTELELVGYGTRARRWGDRWRMRHQNKRRGGFRKTGK